MSQLVFAFGSNMDAAQMAHRCPSSDLVAPAELRGQRLLFAGYSRSWGSTVATVEAASRNDVVRGLVWEVSSADLAKLDGYEGAPWTYARDVFPVFVPSGKAVKAHVYRQVTPFAYGAPTNGYLRQIARAYLAMGWALAPLDDAIRQSAARQMHADKQAAATRASMLASWADTWAGHRGEALARETNYLNPVRSVPSDLMITKARRKAR